MAHAQGEPAPVFHALAHVEHHRVPELDHAPDRILVHDHYQGVYELDRGRSRSS